MALQELLGVRFEATMPWLVHCAMTTLHHGWALATTLMSPADADKVLSLLEKEGFLVRGKQDLTYAKEIAAFGVGGQSVDYLKGAPYGCTYCWSPSAKLVDEVTKKNPEPVS